MALFKFDMPEIDMNQLNNEKYVKRIANYLMALEEQLRYMFSHLDEDNFSDLFQQELAKKISKLIVGDLKADSISVSNGINTININPDVIFEILKGIERMIHLDENGDAVFNGHVFADTGEIAGFEFTKDEETGGFYYKGDGKFFRISPLSSYTGKGGNNTKYASIDLGTIDEDGNILTNIHLRSDGYARFGHSLDGNTYSVRINDYLRYRETEGEEGSDTIFYSQNFKIYTDGTISINSPDISKRADKIKPITNSDGYIIGMILTFGELETPVEMQFNAQGKCIKLAETTIEW